MTQKSLNNTESLTQDDIDQIARLLAKPSQPQLRSLVAELLQDFSNFEKKLPIFNRLVKNSDGVWEFLSEANHAQEINLCRNLLIFNLTDRI